MRFTAREYSTEIGPADYVLFDNKEPVGIIEAKREEEVVEFSVHEQQVEDYPTAKLKYIDQKLFPFLYLSNWAL